MDARILWKGALAVLVSGCAVGGSETVSEFAGVTSLAAELGNGEIYLSTSPDEVTRLRYDGGGLGRSAFPEMVQDEQGGLFVDGGGLIGGGELDIEVMGGVPLQAEVERGELTIELSIPASIEACVAAGELSIGVPAGAYDIRIAAGAGAVGLELLHDPNAEHFIQACAGAGEIEIYAYEPGMGEQQED